MSNKIKEELIQIIQNTDDSELLSLMKEDFRFFEKSSASGDITDELSQLQIEELEVLANEDASENSHSYEEFKKATEKWRTK